MTEIDGVKVRVLPDGPESKSARWKHPAKHFGGTHRKTRHAQAKFDFGKDYGSKKRRPGAYDSPEWPALSFKVRRKLKEESQT